MLYDDLQRCLDEAFASHGKIRTLIDSAKQRAKDESLTNPSALRIPVPDASPQEAPDKGVIQ